jgi:hypothetical protein
MQAATQTWNSIGATTNKWYVRLMPSLTDLAFLLPVLLLFNNLSGTKVLFSDGDTGWHIRTGEWILAHGTVPYQDLFSFTKPHDAWFAWEWGWDVLFALVHQFSGLSGVAFVTVILLGAVGVLLYKLVLRACGNYLLAVAVTAVALCGTSIHWLARPHLFSWVFFLLFLHLLEDAAAGKTRAFYWMPVLMLFWTNIHGSFFVGIILISIAAAGKAAQSFWIRRESLRQAYQSARPFAVCAGICAAMTLINPYGWHVHKHIFTYLSDSRLMDNIQEFQSLSFHNGPARFFEAMLLVGCVAAFRSLQRGKVTPALSVFFWAHLALVAGRNMPLFLMVAAPPVATLIQEGLRRFGDSPAFGSAIRTISEVSDEVRPIERIPRLHLVSGLAVLVLAALFASGSKGFEGQFNPDTFPAQALSVVTAAGTKRIFTYDQWGDYLIYRLYPSQKVFMDGRSDFYGSEFGTATQQIIGANYDCMKQLNRFAVDMVLIKPDAPLSTVLKSSARWKLLFDDGKVLVFKTIPPGREVSVTGGLSSRSGRVLG